MITDDMEMLPQRIVWCKAITVSEKSGLVVVNQENAMLGKEEYAPIYASMLWRYHEESLEHDPPHVSIHQILRAAAAELGTSTDSVKRVGTAAAPAALPASQALVANPTPASADPVTSLKAQLAIVERDSTPCRHKGKEV